MKDPLAVLKAVDLDGYSASKGFIGFFAAQNELSWPTAMTASAHCLQYVLRERKEARILSSAHIDPEALLEGGDKSGAERQVVERLMERRLLPAIDYSAFGTDYASARYKRGLSEARSNFRILQIDEFSEHELVEFFAAKMFVYGVFGHCFLHLVGQGLLLYPHDDLGFGVIAIDEGSDHAFARRMLSDVGLGPLFVSHESDALRGGH